MFLAACGVEEGGGSEPPVTVRHGDVLVTGAGDLAGLADVERIEGDLIVRPAANVEEVELSALAAIEGSLRVEDLGGNRAPFALSLPSLARVGLDVAVARAGVAVTLELPAVTLIAGHLRIEEAEAVSVSAASLEVLNGDLRASDAAVGTLQLPALDTIGGSVRLVRYRGPVEQVTLAFPSLARVAGGVLFREGSTTVLEAPRLAAIDGDLAVSDVRLTLTLAGLTRVRGNVRAERCTLSDLALPALATIDGDLALIGMSLGGDGDLPLPSLARIGGALEVSRIAGLRTVDLGALAQVDTQMRITDNGELQKVRLAAMTVLHSDLEVSHSGGPVSVELPVATRIGGSLVLEDDGQAALLLPELVDLVGSLRISGTTLSAFSAPKLATVSQAIRITDCSALSPQPLAFPALASVTNDLRIEATIGFTSVSLPSLVSVGSVPQGHPIGSLVVADNETVAALALPALDMVVMDLVVRGNPALSSTAVAGALAGVAVGGARTICANRADEPDCP